MLQGCWCPHLLPLTCHPPQAQLRHFLHSSGQARACLLLAGWLRAFVPPLWAFQQRPLHGHCSLGHGHQRPCVACVWLPMLQGLTVGGSLAANGLSGLEALGHLPGSACHCHPTLSLSPALAVFPRPHALFRSTAWVASVGLPQVLVILGCEMSNCWVRLPPAGGDRTCQRKRMAYRQFRQQRTLSHSRGPLRAAAKGDSKAMGLVVFGLQRVWGREEPTP